MKNTYFLMGLLALSAIAQAQTITVSGATTTIGVNTTYTLNNSGSFQYTPIEGKDTGTDSYFSSTPIFSATGQYQIYRRSGVWKIGRVICNGCFSPQTDIYYTITSPTTKPPCMGMWNGSESLALTGDCVTIEPSSVKATTILPTAVSVPQLIASDIAAIASPQKGMLVYDLTNSCLKVYNGMLWKCLAEQ